MWSNRDFSLFFSLEPELSCFDFEHGEVVGQNDFIAFRPVIERPLADIDANLQHCVNLVVLKNTYNELPTFIYRLAAYLA